MFQQLFSCVTQLPCYLYVCSQVCGVYRDVYTEYYGICMNFPLVKDNTFTVRKLSV